MSNGVHELLQEFCQVLATTSLPAYLSLRAQSSVAPSGVENRADSRTSSTSRIEDDSPLLAFNDQYDTENASALGAFHQAFVPLGAKQLALPK